MATDLASVSDNIISEPESVDVDRPTQHHYLSFDETEQRSVKQ